LKIIGYKEEYIALVKNPKYGYGKNMNPCIDCRIFMFSKAREIMEETSVDFVFTGEVLGERPMSQNLRAMKIIEKESGLEGRLLRPLCAKHLPPTIVEKQGIVDRDRLLSITGRSRKPQISLAQSLGIDDYPCPAGGCRLTEPNFARRLRDAFKHNEDSLLDITLLRYGRHFRLASGAKVIVGRNEQENKILAGSASENRILLEVKDVKGPIALIYKHNGKGDIELAARICLAYSDYNGKDKASVRVGDDREIFVQPVTVFEFKKIMI
jgi:tRNA U34 2-thiouridine synthase MnmA/TrmU